MAVTLLVAGLTDVGVVRTNNEDAFVVADLDRDAKADVAKATEFDVKDKGMLLAVSDGMGGEAAGEVASGLVIETLRRVLATAAASDEVSNSGIAKAVENAVTRANEAVWKEAKDPEKRGMGATLTAVYVQGATAYIAEVGDSRAYLVRGSRIRQMTKDQSFVQLLLDSGALTKEEAEAYPHKNIILQAMGQQEKVSVALGKLALRRSDRLLICSDGLSNKVTPVEMKEAILSGDPLDVVCTKLVALANERGGEDNCTIILAQAEGDGLQPFRDAERVTQTFEVVKEGPGAGGLEDDKKAAKKNAPAAPAPKAEEPKEPKEPKAEELTAEATVMPEPEEDKDEDDKPLPVPKPPTEEELKSRPQQMIVAVVMIVVMLAVFYYILKG